MHQRRGRFGSLSGTTVSTGVLAIGTLLGLVIGLAALSLAGQRANEHELQAEQQRVLDAVQAERVATARDVARLADLTPDLILRGDLGDLDQVYLVDVGQNTSTLLAGTRPEGADLRAETASLARVVGVGDAASDAAMLPSAGDLFDGAAVPYGGTTTHPRPVLVGLRRVDSAYLGALAASARVADLRLSRMAPEAADRGSVRSGTWGGFSLVWNVEKPGDALVLRWTTGGVVLSALVALLIILRARRIANELHASEARAVEASRNDWLSGLPNRVFFNSMLERELASLAQRGARLALLYIDVDRFKEVNETFGIEAGDRLIQAITQRIAGVAEPGVSIARFEGDAFIVLQPNIASPADCDRLAEAIRGAMKATFDVGEARIAATLSIGVALAPDDASERTQLVRLANMAAHRAKQEGRDRLCFYTPVMQDEWRRRSAVERELRDAIENGGLTLRFQPIVDARTGAVVCAEALVRWQHPTEGLIPPDRFIGIAEDRGLILPLGERVLREACRAASAWPGVRVAVNVSPVQFRQSDFVATVGAVLAETGFDPSCLELEITEGVLMAAEAEAAAAMAELRRRGIRIALDDFGTGYSSLIYLRRFAIDKIKIDKAFIDALEPGGESAILVESVVSLGQALGLTVTAEGVETVQQRDVLRTFACHQLQGYLIAKPLTEADFVAFLSRHGADRLREAEPALAVA